MPPRKSTASAVSGAPTSPPSAVDASILSTTTAASKDTRSPTTQKGSKQSTRGGSGDVEGEKSEKKKSRSDDLGIDDLLLPRTLTSRLSRGTLPPNTSIQRDALLALTKSATVFISYLAHNANNLTSRKTIQSQDILEALREVELWNVPIPTTAGEKGPSNHLTLGERVKAEVEKWEGEVRGKRKGYRERVKARESGVSTVSTGVDAGDADDVEDEQEDRGPTTKRVRRSSVDEDTTVERETTTITTTMDVDNDSDVDDDEEDAPATTTTTKRKSKDKTESTHPDGTETDPDVPDQDEEEEDDDDDDDDEDQDDAEIDDEAESNQDEDEDEDEDETNSENADDGDEEEEDPRTKPTNLHDDSRNRTALAPNGRIEVGSDEESD